MLVRLRVGLNYSPQNLALMLGIYALAAVPFFAGGLVLTLAISRLVGNFIYGVSPYDPLTYVSVTAILGIVALLACYFPARRATLVDPMIALRYE